jgi:integrase
MVPTWTAMKKESFTAARIEAYACQPGKQQSIYWDVKAPGLGLRVTAAGSRAYIFESRLYGKTIRVTIGGPRSWDLGKARIEAGRLKTLIDDGKDPRQVRAEQRAVLEAIQREERRREVTFEDAWTVYLKARKPHWSARTYQDHVRHSAAGGREKKIGEGVTVPGVLATLRPLLLSELTAQHISDWLALEIQSRPTVTGLAYRMLRAFIRWTGEVPEYAGLIPADAYSAKSVRNLVPKINVRHGDSLQREQLKAWFCGVRSMPNRVLSVYLQGLLITGARREELAALRWADVDLQWRSLSIADKVEQDSGRVIPLTPYFASLLSELKRLNETPVIDIVTGKKSEPSPWVFPSKAASTGRVTDPGVAHRAVLLAAALPLITLHGLRRSFGTLSEWCEVPVGVVAQIQGHKPSAIAEKHYRRRPLDLLRSWHDKIEAWMLEQAGIEFNADVADKGLRAVDAT